MTCCGQLRKRRPKTGPAIRMPGRVQHLLIIRCSRSDPSLSSPSPSRDSFSVDNDWHVHAEQSTKWRALTCKIRAVGSRGVLTRSKENGPSGGGRTQAACVGTPGWKGRPRSANRGSCTRVHETKLLTHELFQQPLNTEHPNRDDDPEHG